MAKRSDSNKKPDKGVRNHLTFVRVGSSGRAAGIRGRRSRRVRLLGQTSSAMHEE